MTPDVQRILYATDLSPNAESAFQYAVYLADKLEAQIFILHVIETLSEDARLAFLAYFDVDQRKKISQERVASVVERIKAKLNQFCRAELQSAPQLLEKIAKIEVCEGYPAEVILNKAQTFDCDLIVVGTHQSDTSHTFLGSVAKRVLRRSMRPVVVIPSMG